MPTNVLPSWFKYLMISLALAACWWCLADSSNSTKHEYPIYTTNGSGIGGGLHTRVGSNIRQFVTNPLEPISSSNDNGMILRDTNGNYYKNEP